MDPCPFQLVALLYNLQHLVSEVKVIWLICIGLAEREGGPNVRFSRA